jgi:hypothetical protein
MGTAYQNLSDESAQIRASQQHGGGGLETGAILVIEPGQMRAIDIENAQELPVLNQRNHDFRTRRGIAGDVSRKGVDIGNDESLPPLGRRAANAAPQRNPDAGDLALKRPENQLAPPQKIEPHPIQFGQGLKEQRGHIGGIGQRITLVCEQRGQLTMDLAVGSGLGQISNPR